MLGTAESLCEFSGGGTRLAGWGGNWVSLLVECWGQPSRSVSSVGGGGGTRLAGWGGNWVNLLVECWGQPSRSVSSVGGGGLG